ncbi:UNVERIFIED_CONTAM: hypothetical protein FKN15_023675 [Acipenser sinensis]
MAVEARPELVGKRFLCVSGEELPELGEIGRWGWRAGVIRAVTHRDNDNPELTTQLHVQRSQNLTYYQILKPIELRECSIPSLPCSHLRATASEDNTALRSLLPSPQVPGQSTGVAGTR